MCCALGVAAPPPPLCAPPGACSPASGGWAAAAPPPFGAEKKRCSMIGIPAALTAAICRRVAKRGRGESKGNASQPTRATAGRGCGIQLASRRARLLRVFLVLRGHVGVGIVLPSAVVARLGVPQPATARLREVFNHTRSTPIPHPLDPARRAAPPRTTSIDQHETRERFPEIAPQMRTR